MAKEHDVIVFGAGHNGLTAAAYLAKAGLDVCVLEKNSNVGGGCVTKEVVAPGFKHDLASGNHTAIQANPLIVNDELGLISKYGLKYYYPKAPYSVMFPDGRAFIGCRDLDKMCTLIERDFSAHDADAYRRFIEWSMPGIQMIARGLGTPPPPYGEFTTMLDQNDEGREVLRALLLSPLDVLNDWFENDFVKMALARYVSEPYVGPREKGTGLYSYLMCPWIHKYPLGIPEGGSGALPEKLAAFLTDAGATIRTKSPVKRVIVHPGGEARGVILESGEEVLARKAVISSVNVKQLFLEMLVPDELSPNFQHKVRRLHQIPFMPFVVHLALHEAPKYKSGTDPTNEYGVHVECETGDMQSFLRFFDELSYGKVQTCSPLCQIFTLWDKTRAPEGNHVGCLYHYEPSHLKEGPEHWDEIKEQVAQGILEAFRKYTTNMGDENIIGMHVNSPLDIERHNSAMIGGDFMHIGNYIYQLLSMRPIPGWGNYRTPVDKLFMCGASTHPGGGVTAGSGRAVAQVLCEDLGIDFEKLVQ